MFNSTKYVLTATILLFCLCVQAQYHENTYMVSFEPGTTQAEIDQAKSDLHSIELAITPITQTRLWKVTVPFPFIYQPTGELISDINETDDEAHNRPKTNGGGLNYVTTPILGTSPGQGGGNSGAYDPQNDCQGNLSTYVNSGTNPVRVGVFDTGLEYLGNPNIPNYYFDLDGYNEWDHLNNDPVAEDVHGHGSHMASIVSHTINKAYGLNQVQFQPNESYEIRKCFDGEGKGYLFEIIDALEHATLAGMNVASCSWSFKAIPQKAYSSPLYTCLSAMESDFGVLVVAAAGNDGDDLGLPRMEHNYPASYDLPNILTATTFNCSSDLASYANYDEQKIDIALPGNKLAGLEYDNLVFKSGTSQSTALLAGIAASLGTNQITFDYEEIICAIMESAEYHNTVKDKVKSDGLINAVQALAMLSNCQARGGGGGGTPKTNGRSRTINSIYPNPSSGVAQLRYNSGVEGVLQIYVSDLQGRILVQSSPAVTTGTNEIALDLEFLSPGFYHLLINNNQKIETHKLVIEK